MQPAAAQIQGEAGRIGDGPRAAAEPRAGFNNETIDAGVAKPPRRGNTGRAAANNHDFDIAARHRPLR